MTQNRLKSWVFWGELITWIVTGMQLFGVFQRLGIDSGQFQDFLIVGGKFAFSMFAAGNNPTNAAGF